MIVTDNSLCGAHGRRCAQVAIWAWLFAQVSGSLFAESGVVEFRPPQPSRADALARTSKDTGLLVRVDTRWREGYGYRPVRFDIESPKPAAVDRTIEVEFLVHDWRSFDHGVVVTQSTELPAGATAVSMTLAAPQLSRWYSIAWEVAVDGVRDPALCCEWDEYLRHPLNREIGFAILSKSERRMPKQATTFETQDPNVAHEEDSGSNFGRLILEQVQQPLPDRWLLYSGLDVVRLTIDDLIKTASDDPQTFAALRQWVTSGGSLWIEDVGPGYRRGKEASQLLSLSQGPRFLASLQATGPIEDAPEWRWVDLYWRSRGEVVDFSEEALRREFSRRSDRRALSSEQLFAEAPLGFGAVALFEESWEKALQDSESRRARSAFSRYWASKSWPQRHGLSPESANSDFSNLLIPDVGLAPVTEFRVLITLFVLIVGPLNFWLLSRRQRTHLMVLTVPFTAAVLTLCLFAYAILSDGFGVQVRTRGLTMLDQTSGEQSTWLRNCYYAGMAPSGGMVFPESAAVYPVLPGWDDVSSAAMQRGRAVSWGDLTDGGVGQQRLSRGWLTSRESTQLLVIDAEKTPAKIDFTQRGDRLIANNRLGADATLLVVLDADGNHWWGESLAEEQATPLDPIEKPGAIGKLREIISRNQPLPPAGLEAASKNPMLDQQRRQMRRRLRREMGMDYAATALSDNLMNHAIERLIGLDGGEPLSLPPRSYVAVLPKAVIASVGLQDVAESESFHMVIGRW